MSDSLWPQDSTVHGILLARILEWVAVPFSRGSFQPRDWTQVSSITGRFFTSWATREAQGVYTHIYKCFYLYANVSMVSPTWIHTNVHLYYPMDHCTPLQYSCLENPMDRGAWWAAVHGVARSRTRLSDFTFTFLCLIPLNSTVFNWVGLSWYLSW